MSKYQNTSTNVMNNNFRTGSSLDYSNGCNVYMLGNTVIPKNVLIGRNIAAIKELSDTEVLEHKYYFKPHYYSYEKYNTTELWYVLLMINSIYDISDFRDRSILYPTKAGCELIVSLINSRSSIVSRELIVSRLGSELIIKKI